MIPNVVIEQPKRKRIRLNAAAYRQNHPFFITISTFNKYPWFQIHPKLAEKLSATILDVSAARGTLVYAWCIMPDHVHLLLQDSDIVAFVRMIKGRVSPYSRRLEPGRKLWQRSFYDHALRSEETIFDVARYIFGNAVRAKLVTAASDYPLYGSLVWPKWRQKLTHS